MYRSDPYIVLTRDGAAKIANSASSGGRIAMRHAPSEGAYIVDVVETAKDVRVQVAIPPQYTALKWGDSLHTAQWMKQPVEGLNLQHLALIRRPGISIPFDNFRELVPTVDDPRAQLGLLITYDPDLPQMRASFIASGPAFRERVELPVFDNVDVYPLLMRLLRLPAEPNDGDIAPLLPALRDAP